MRWWLKRSDEGEWRVYDWEDLDGAMRQSTIMVSFFGSARSAGDTRKALKKLREYVAVALAFQNEHPEQAELALAKFLKRDLPRQLEFGLLMMTAATKLELDKPKEALEICSEVLGRGADMPILFLLRAQAYNELWRHTEALADVHKYQAILGTTAASCRVLGDTLLALEKNTEAVRAFKEGLEDDPDSRGNLLGLALALPEKDKSQIAPYLAKLRKPREDINPLAQAILRRWDMPALEALMTAYRPLAPKDTRYQYYMARVLTSRKQYDAAVRMIFPVIAKITDRREQKAYTSVYLDAMIGQKKYIEAYHNSPDSAYAFDYLADDLADREDVKRLSELIENHRRYRPHDPWLKFYTGRMHLLAKHYPQAAESFGAGWRNAKGNDDREVYRREYVYALHKSGRAMDAYRTVTPRDETFAQLANLLEYDEKPDGLQALLDAHRPAAGSGDRNIPLWQAQVHWLRKDYASVVKTLDASRRRILAPMPTGQQDTPSYDPNPYTFDRLKVHSLLHLRRFDEALAAAKASTKRDDDPWYEAQVYAAMGDVKRTEATLARLVELGWDGEEFMDDEFLGKALATEPFSALRAKYAPPPPTTRPAATRPSNAGADH